jgi:toluene monooxygenase system ferredoxin subunit
MTFRKVGTLEDLWSGEMMPCAVAGRKVLLVRFDEHVYAYDDRCAHLGVPLSRGRLEGEVLTCSAHHYEYDVRTGRGINPKSVCMTAYPVKVQGSEIFVDADGPSGGQAR